MEKKHYYTAADFIPISFDDVNRLLRKIEAGLAISALQRFQKRTGLPMARVAKLIRIAPRTLSRRREEGRLSPEESDRLIRVSRVVAGAANLFGGNVASGVNWLSKPLRAFGGSIPLEVIETNAGAYEVERVMLQLEHGIFT